MRFSWSVSRVLSLKAIINLDAILLLHSSGHGNERAAHMFHTLHLTEFTANYCHQYFEWALTSLFHHCLCGLYISVALFLKSPWLDVIKRDCSVVLGLSSHIMCVIAQPTIYIISQILHIVNYYIFAKNNII